MLKMLRTCYLTHQFWDSTGGTNYVYPRATTNVKINAYPCFRDSLWNSNSYPQRSRTHIWSFDQYPLRLRSVWVRILNANGIRLRNRASWSKSWPLYLICVYYLHNETQTERHSLNVCSYEQINALYHGEQIFRSQTKTLFILTAYLEG